MGLVGYSQSSARKMARPALNTPTVVNLQWVSSSSSVVSPKPPLARAIIASSSSSFWGSSDRRFSSACCVGGKNECGEISVLAFVQDTTTARIEPSPCGGVWWTRFCTGRVFLPLPCCRVDRCGRAWSSGWAAGTSKSGSAVRDDDCGGCAQSSSARECMCGRGWAAGAPTPGLPAVWGQRGARCGTP